MTNRRSVLHGAAAGALLAGLPKAFAQGDMSTVTVLVGAASSMDFTARAIADHLHATLNRPVIAVSKLGAGQRVAIAECKRAAPDGRTLVFATTGPFAIHPHVYKKLEYDPLKDFTPVIGFSKFDVAVAVNAQLGVNTLPELIDWVKKQKGATVFASAPGNGSFSHFIGLAISREAGLHMKHVPYRDSGVGIVDLAAGRIPIMLTGFSPLIPMHLEGKIKILGTSGAKRNKVVPDIPTVSEGGISVASSTTTGLFAPAGMPKEIVDRYYQAVLPLTQSASLVEKLRGQGVEMWPATGEQLADEIVREHAYFGKLAKDAGFEPS